MSWPLSSALSCLSKYCEVPDFQISHIFSLVLLCFPFLFFSPSLCLHKLTPSFESESSDLLWCTLKEETQLSFRGRVLVKHHQCLYTKPQSKVLLCGHPKILDVQGGKYCCNCRIFSIISHDLTPQTQYI